MAVRPRHSDLRRHLEIGKGALHNQIVRTNPPFTKGAMMTYRLLTVAVLLSLLNATADAADDAVPVGVAKCDITPVQPVRMYGYAASKTESQGIAGRLKASALTLGGDEGDGPAILLCVDCGSVPEPIRNEVYRRVTRKVAVRPERFMLCNSHNHSGPNLKGMNSIDGPEHDRLAHYARELTDRLEQVVLESLSARRPARLAWTQGDVGFATNRRMLKNGKWTGFGAVPEGAADRSLPLLRAVDLQGRLLAVVVNYACHNTTLRGNFKEIHGDWAGCAQEYIEADHPGAVALVTIGCGADADPCPHGTVELCRQHGRALADEVKRLLAGPMKAVSPPLTARMTILEIPYAPLPPVDVLEKAGQLRSAQRALRLLQSGQQPPKAEPYRIAVWAFGGDLAMAFLADEVVADFALRMKRQMDGSRLWINAYSNDVSYYVVSDRLIGEGGYEVNGSLSAQVSYGQPETVHPTIEERIVAQVRDLLPASYRNAATTAPR